MFCWKRFKYVIRIIRTGDYMAMCDMCSKIEERLFTSRVEGVTMKVCSGCTKYGETLKKPERPKPTFKRNFVKKEQEVKPVFEERLNDEFSALLKKARESKGLTQEEVSKRINEKQSLLHNVERGSQRPNLELAKKLERFFGIKIIDKLEVKKEKIKIELSGEGMTIGDIFSKIKK